MTDESPELVTYRRADGELIYGEFQWVTDIEFFDWHVDDPGCMEIIEERWRLTSQKTLKFGTLERWCTVCESDVLLAEPVEGPVYCPEHAGGRTDEL